MMSLHLQDHRMVGMMERDSLKRSRVKETKGVRKFQSLRLGKTKLEDEFFSRGGEYAGHVRAPTPLA
ncbi:hypothetical protein Tco_1271795 [Tanacetum coccineum]